MKAPPPGQHRTSDATWRSPKSPAGTVLPSATGRRTSAISIIETFPFVTSHDSLGGQRQLREYAEVIAKIIFGRNLPNIIVVNGLITAPQLDGTIQCGKVAYIIASDTILLSSILLDQLPQESTLDIIHEMRHRAVIKFWAKPCLVTLNIDHPSAYLTPGALGSVMEKVSRDYRPALQGIECDAKLAGLIGTRILDDRSLTEGEKEVALQRLVLIGTSYSASW